MNFLSRIAQVQILLNLKVKIQFQPKAWLLQTFWEEGANNTNATLE